jgi:hypothetical protein
VLTLVALVTSVIHLLRSHGFPTAALVDSIPPCIYGVLVALPASSHPPTDQELFELCLTVLMKWARVLWDETLREAKGELWGLAEEVLEREGTSGPRLREKVVAPTVSHLHSFEAKLTRPHTFAAYHRQRRPWPHQRRARDGRLDVSER